MIKDIGSKGYDNVGRPLTYLQQEKGHSEVEIIRARVEAALSILGEVDDNTPFETEQERHFVVESYVVLCDEIMDVLEDGIARYGDKAGYEALLHIRQTINDHICVYRSYSCPKHSRKRSE